MLFDSIEQILTRSRTQSIYLHSEADVFLRRGPNRIGSVYTKAIFRQYTDRTFSRKVAHDPHLGFMGPILRAEVGDIVIIHFRNFARIGNFSVHPHGIQYMKNSEGARYMDDTFGPDKADDALGYADAHTYVWNMTESFAPTHDDDNCVPWAYHSHTMSERDVDTGLLGVLITCKPGILTPDGRRRDVDTEKALYFDITNETSSWYGEQNLRRCGNVRECHRLFQTRDADFLNSNLMHNINGYMYGHLPGLDVCEGQRVAVYMFSLNLGYHTVYTYGQTMVVKGRRCHGGRVPVTCIAVSNIELLVFSQSHNFFFVTMELIALKYCADLTTGAVSSLRLQHFFSSNLVEFDIDLVRHDRADGHPDSILFTPDCIFCNSTNLKKVKAKGGWWTTEGLSIFDKDGWISILERAEKKKDDRLLTRIRGRDLFACEAKYHKSCRIAYMQDPMKWRSRNEEGKKRQENGKVSRSDADISNAIRKAYELGSRDMIEETGAHLNQEIWTAFETSDELTWPPTAQTLLRNVNVLPPSLEKFLTCLLSGNRTRPENSRLQRIVSSIGQDICRAATNGEWKLPKHVLICLTLHHMFRSKQLIAISTGLLGHCENYPFALELETAIAEAAEQSSQMLSSQIIREPGEMSVFHSEFDNFDQMINTLTGSGSVHTAHGIMLQEVSSNVAVPSNAPTIPRSKRRTLEVTSVELPDCYVTQRKSPKLDIRQQQYTEGPPALKTSSNRQLLWLLLRRLCEHCVPGLGGFISQTGKAPERLTTIDYYPVIPNPITDYKTVQECLRHAEQATEEVGQEYVFTTFDLGVCMKAYPLVWNNAERYRKHIIMIGTFHLICAYLKMVGKKMAGSGFSDILLEAGLITSGSIEGVLKGKHYERAMNCHKVMFEGLEPLLDSSC
ncbi:hypothetical protein ScPMuIL_002030 [Solemya velum]